MTALGGVILVDVYVRGTFAMLALLLLRRCMYTYEQSLNGDTLIFFSPGASDGGWRYTGTATVQRSATRGDQSPYGAMNMLLLLLPAAALCLLRTWFFGKLLCVFPNMVLAHQHQYTYSYLVDCSCERR